MTNNVQTIDQGAGYGLGTSTEQSVPNLGLVTFKEGLGCLTSGKRTYSLRPT